LAHLFGSRGVNFYSIFIFELFLSASFIRTCSISTLLVIGLDSYLAEAAKP
jgi:hypothetical protein